METGEKMAAKRVLLNSGKEFPLIGFGTYKITGTQLIRNVLDAALKSGYRSIDTAECYHNEADIGSALKELLPKYNLQRSDIQITTKLFTTDQGKDRARAAALKSIETLNCEYLDLYLIHWPGSGRVLANSPENARLRKESWQDLVQLYNEGILRNIGVSNYTIRHLKELNADCSGVRPAVNQVELHPRYQQRDLLDYCKKEGILVQAYFSLGGTGEKSLLDNPAVNAVAKRLEKTPAQILLRWALEKGVAIIPKSVTPSRIEQNLQLDFPLPVDAVAEVDNITEDVKFSWDPETVK